MVVQIEPYTPPKIKKLETKKPKTDEKNEAVKEGTAVKLTRIMRHPTFYELPKSEQFNPAKFLKTKEFTANYGKIRTLSVIHSRSVYVAEANRKEQQAKQQQEEEGIDGKEDSIAAVL
eukprot:GHVU01099802.1.p1 GENE.GHVU01099802.1~~GHVU01099802.1.p1  ORF type:complete len:118 (-),score=27.30 GHVU01099802.1:564-917(-)